MIKKTIFIFFVACVSAQVQYNPVTGEPIQQKKFDPNTGEEIDQKFDPNTGKPLKIKKEGISAKVILISGDIVQGKLVSQDKEKIMVESEMAGMVSIGRDKIKSMLIGGVPMSARRSTRAPIVKDSASPKNTTTYQTLAMRAKNEALNKNQRSFNMVIGTGACLIAPYITLPVMGVAIAGNMGVADPESNYYKDLDLELKKQYKTIYRKETKRLRNKQCFTPTLVVGSGIAVMLGFFIFTGV